MLNKTKVDRLNDLLPKHLNTKTNPNWSVLLAAIGEQDQSAADLIGEVKDQFFVKTASRPYIDRLAANSQISRPKLVGMDDQSFRQYIPVLSYQPKQVKIIIDQLLDIFFFKESTTAFISSLQFSPFALQDGWELFYNVDEVNEESIKFNATDFTDITQATVDEVVSAINRQAKYSYATSYDDSVTKDSFIRLFTNTVGSKGSIRIEGGRANIALQFNGFISTSGNGSNTQWSISKIGDEITLQYVSGGDPGLSTLQVGDILISNLTDNIGSFPITDINLSSGSIKFINLFGTVGTYTQTSNNDTKFIRPQKYVAYTNPRRAMTWEVTPGEIIVEMPTSPPVVKRSLKGSAHFNGSTGKMLNRDSDTSLTLDLASSFPDSGTFWLQEMNEIQTHIMTTSEDVVISVNTNSRLQANPQKYNYTSRTVLTTTGTITQGLNTISGLVSTAGIVVGQSVAMPGIPAYALVVDVVGNTVTVNQLATLSATSSVSFLGNTLSGITPNLPLAASLNSFALSSLVIAGNVVTGTTSSAHNFTVGDAVIINGSVFPSAQMLDGVHEIEGITSDTFMFKNIGADDTAITTGTARVERMGLANSGSLVILTDALSKDITRITGSYVWDLNAPFVLSSNIAMTSDLIQAGKIVRLLNVTTNTIDPNGGSVIFDYGLSTQEGPVRYLYAPTNTTIAIDPSYIFQFDHAIGAAVTAINSKGPHAMSTFATEFPPYITSPSEARFILEDLIKSVKSAGIFVDFLVRFPEQLYATLDVYQSDVS